jgi:hypothetical protein
MKNDYKPIEEMAERAIIEELASILADAKAKTNDDVLVPMITRAAVLTDAICNVAYDFLADKPA